MRQNCRQSKLLSSHNVVLILLCGSNAQVSTECVSIVWGSTLMEGQQGAGRNNRELGGKKADGFFCGTPDNGHSLVTRWVTTHHWLDVAEKAAGKCRGGNWGQIVEKSHILEGVPYSKASAPVSQAILISLLLHCHVVSASISVSQPAFLAQSPSQFREQIPRVLSYPTFHCLCREQIFPYLKAASMFASL